VTIGNQGEINNDNNNYIILLLLLLSDIIIYVNFRNDGRHNGQLERTLVSRAIKYVRDGQIKNKNKPRPMRLRTAQKAVILELMTFAGVGGMVKG